MSFEIHKATRQGVRPLIALYGESGTGKTYSALLLARGFVGPSGKIVMADSESGRGSLYADVLPGGYDTLDLTGPFSPARYIEAIEAVEASGATIGIIDSASHEWEGIGGVLDSAGDNEQRSGKAGLHNWKTPKLEHAKFMLRLLQSSIPWIVCLRAKFKSRQIKNERGKTEIVKDDLPSPIQAEDFIFEMTAHALVLPSHGIRLTKCSHPSLRECFPQSEDEPITSEHGAAIAAWANGGGAKSKPQQSSARPADPQVEKGAVAPAVAGDGEQTTKNRRQVAALLWSMVKADFDDAAAFEKFLHEKNVITPDETLATLDIQRLREVMEKMKV